MSLCMQRYNSIGRPAVRTEYLRTCNRWHLSVNTRQSVACRAGSPDEDLSNRASESTGAQGSASSRAADSAPTSATPVSSQDAALAPGRQRATPLSLSRGDQYHEPAAPSAAAGGDNNAPSWWVQRLQRLQQAAGRWLRSPHDAAIYTLAVPAILALAADPLLSMVDTAFVGHLGGNDLAALGVNTSLFSFAFVVFNFLATATTPLVATAVSKNDAQKAGQVTYQAGIMALVLGGGVALALSTHADDALHVMGLDGQDAALFQLARDYLLLRATAAPAALLVTVGQGVFRGIQNMTVPLYVTIGTNVLHLGLDLLLIFHLRMGLSGAALSVSISEWAAATAYCALLWRERGPLGLWPPPSMELATLGQRYLPFVQAGGAVLMRTAVLLGTKTLATAVATRMGPSNVAAHQVLMQLWLLSSMLVDSLAVSGQTLVAVSLGQDRRREAREVSDRLLQLGLALGGGLAVAMAAASPWLPHLFTSEEEVLDSIYALLPLALALLPVNAAVYVLDGILVGAADFRFLAGAMVLASVSAAGMLLCVEPFDWGLQGVWLSMAVLMAGRLATLGYRYQSAAGPVPPELPAAAKASTAGDAAPGIGSADARRLPTPTRANPADAATAAGTSSTELRRLPATTVRPRGWISSSSGSGSSGGGRSYSHGNDGLAGSLASSISCSSISGSMSGSVSGSMSGSMSSLSSLDEAVITVSAAAASTALPRQSRKVAARAAFVEQQQPQQQQHKPALERRRLSVRARPNVKPTAIGRDRS